MSALGQKQTCAVQLGMSALPPKADIPGGERDVRFVPQGTFRTSAAGSRRCASSELRNFPECIV
jgi:hypothetical protein